MSRPWVYRTKDFLDKNAVNFCRLTGSLFLGSAATTTYHRVIENDQSFLPGILMILAIALLPNWKK